MCLISGCIDTVKTSIFSIVAELSVNLFLVQFRNMNAATSYSY